jgi:alanine racemase
MDYLNRIIISCDSLAYNHEQLQKQNSNVKVCHVIKSNAFGHGIEEISTLVDKYGSPFIIVDSVYEADRIRKLVKTQILVLGSTPSHDFEYNNKYSYAVFDLDLIRALNRAETDVHIFVDTGMCREGIQLKDLRDFVRRIKAFKNISIKGLCSHFADADNPVSFSFTQKQLDAYKSALSIVSSEGIVPQWRHISGSAGMIKVMDPVFNMVRIGISTFGINPLSKEDKQYHEVTLKLVLKFISTLVLLKNIRRGAKIGYNGTFVAKKDMKIGIIPVGYYHGLDRRLSNCGCVIISDTICPIIGRVSMNMTIIDCSSLKTCKLGDQVTIISSNDRDPNNINNLSSMIGSIPHELLVRIPESLPRIIA